MWLSLVRKRDLQPAQCFALKEPSQSEPYRARDREQRDKVREKGERIREINIICIISGAYITINKHIKIN
jgi:hypothetical protein